MTDVVWHSRSAGTWFVYIDYGLTDSKWRRKGCKLEIDDRGPVREGGAWAPGENRFNAWWTATRNGSEFGRGSPSVYASTLQEAQDRALKLAEERRG